MFVYSLIWADSDARQNTFSSLTASVFDLQANLNTVLLDMRLTNRLVKINNASLLSFQQITLFEQITNQYWSI